MSRAGVVSLQLKPYFFAKKKLCSQGSLDLVNAQVKAPGSTLSLANPTASLSLGLHSLQRIWEAFRTWLPCVDNWY